MLHFDGGLGHHCVTAEFLGTGKVEKSRFCHFLWQKHNSTFGGDSLWSYITSLSSSWLSFLQVFGEVAKEMSHTETGLGTKKIDACDGKEVDQMFLRMSLCPGIVRC